MLITGSHQYRIVSEISRGGFGITYEAENLREFRVGTNVIRAGQRLVVKECCHSRAERECMVRLESGLVRLLDVDRGMRIRRQFYQEALSMKELLKLVPPDQRSKLTNGFVPIYHAGVLNASGTLNPVNGEPDYRSDSIIFFVMPYVDGGSLKNVVLALKQFQGAQRLERLSPGRFIGCVRKLLGALAKVHTGSRELNVKPKIHCDIKPDNIMMTRNRDVLLIDFGGVTDEQGRNNINVQTPAYASPEQLLRRRPTVQSDLYSLAVTFYHVLTGNQVKLAVMPTDTRSLSSVGSGGARVGYSQGYQHQALSKQEELVDFFSPSFQGHRERARAFLATIDVGMEISPAKRWKTAGDWLRSIPEGWTPPPAPSAPQVPPIPDAARPSAPRSSGRRSEEFSRTSHLERGTMTSAKNSEYYLKLTCCILAALCLAVFVASILIYVVGKG